MLTQYERNLIAQITYDIHMKQTNHHKKNSDYLVMWAELSAAAKTDNPNDRQKEMLKVADKSKKELF